MASAGDQDNGPELAPSDKAPKFYPVTAEGTVDIERIRVTLIDADLMAQLEVGGRVAGIGAQGEIIAESSDGAYLMGSLFREKIILDPDGGDRLRQQTVEKARGRLKELQNKIAAEDLNALHEIFPPAIETLDFSSMLRDGSSVHSRRLAARAAERIRHLVARRTAEEQQHSSPRARRRVA